MPLPAPAVTQLLKGWVFHDDGLEGERITPTGAAILKFLGPAQASTCKPLRLSHTGLGFGSRRFKNTSNVLRLMAFEDAQNAVEWREEKIVQIHFEIDDQTAEDLSVALDLLRREPGVLDVSQWSAIGKKGRQFMAVQILTEDAQLNATIRQCFLQTTTIGLRYNTVHRACLPRTLSRKEYSNNESAHSKAVNFGIKETTRPGQQISLKAEMDDIKLSATTRVERQNLRTWLEQDADILDHSGPNANQQKK